VAAGATGVEREVIGNPWAGPEPRVARHELRQVVAGLRVAAEAREGHVRSELAALELDAAVARDPRHLLLQPVEPPAALDGGAQRARLLAAAELPHAGQRHGKARPLDVGQLLLEIAHGAALNFAREAQRDMEVLR